MVLFNQKLAEMGASRVSKDYSTSRATAKRLIEKFGQSATVTVKGNDGGFDPDTGDTIAAVPDQTISGIATPVLQFKNSEIDGTTIKHGDAYFFFHSDVEPPIGALFTENGNTWRLESLMQITSLGGINVYRKYQLRKGL